MSADDDFDDYEFEELKPSFPSPNITRDIDVDTRLTFLVGLIGEEIVRRDVTVKHAIDAAILTEPFEITRCLASVIQAQARNAWEMREALHRHLEAHGVPSLVKP